LDVEVGFEACLKDARLLFPYVAAVNGSEFTLLLNGVGYDASLLFFFKVLM